MGARTARQNDRPAFFEFFYEKSVYFRLLSRKKFRKLFTFTRKISKKHVFKKYFSFEKKKLRYFLENFLLCVPGGGGGGR